MKINATVYLCQPPSILKCYRINVEAILKPPKDSNQRIGGFEMASIKENGA
jgi:hypothetical protein